MGKTNWKNIFQLKLVELKYSKTYKEQNVTIGFEQIGTDGVGYLINNGLIEFYVIDIQSKERFKIAE